VGIHALASAESLPLVVEVTSADGQQVSLATTVEIISGDYGQETIHFDPETSKLLDPAISEPENVLMGEVWATFTPDILWADLFQWPVVGPFTSYFGTRRSYGGQVSSYHAGLDIDGETGDSVMAAADGVVAFVEPLQVRGNVVVIDHGAGVLTGYFHLDSFAVEVGQSVEAGDVIGTMGATGLVTGSHLHWELHVGGIATSPAEWTERAPLP
jgi:murein DD-endopeptidase MepM/ murein hydrolase activator NlpD